MKGGSQGGVQGGSKGRAAGAWFRGVMNPCLPANSWLFCLRTWRCAITRSILLAHVLATGPGPPCPDRHAARHPPPPPGGPNNRREGSTGFTATQTERSA